MDHTTHPRLAARRLAAALALALPLALPAAAGAGEKEPPPQTWDGLERRPSASLDNVFVRPGVPFTAYKKVQLDPIQVEFDKTWDPNRGVKSASNKLYRSDLDRIRSSLAEAFTKVLTDTLTKGGYPIATEPEEDVLRVTASLVKVYVTAPARPSAGPRDTYVMNAGSVTLFMELRDAATGELLARVVDASEGGETGKLQWSTSGSNMATAQQIFMGWAGRLVKALDQVNGKAAK